MNLLAHDFQFDPQHGEARLLPDLLMWLSKSGWIRVDSLVVQEFPVNGRRVDVATLTRTGTLSAYELKLGGFGRVLEQATYNSFTFDRSWVVVDRVPLKKNLEEAERFGVGIMVIDGVGVKVVLRPGPVHVERSLRKRAISRIRSVEVRSV